MKFKAIVEYEYPVEHKPPVKAEIVLHGDRVITDNIKWVEQEHKSGKWIDYSDEEGYVECPLCGHATTCEDNIDELHYCFYCGADMRGAENG